MKGKKKIIINFVFLILLLSLIPLPCLGEFNYPINNWPTFRYNFSRTADPHLSDAYGPPITFRWIADGGSDIEGSPVINYGNAYVGSDVMQVFCFDLFSGLLKWQYPNPIDGSKMGFVDCSPTVVNGVAYISSGNNNWLPHSDPKHWDGKLHAVNAFNGNPIWVYQIQESATYTDYDAQGNPIVRNEKAAESSPAVVDGVVYFGSTNHYLYALNATNGTLKWKFKAGSGDYAEQARILSPPTVVEGAVYFGCYDHYVYSLNASDGSLRWKKELGNVVYGATPVYNDTVYAPCEDGLFYALNSSNGAIKWKFDGNPYVNFSIFNSLPPNQRPPHEEFHSSPAIVNGVIYTGTRCHKVYALKADTGELIWQKDLSGWIFSSPVVNNDIVYVGSYGFINPFVSGKPAKFYGLDCYNGNVVWNYSVSNATYGGCPAFSNNILVYGTGGGPNARVCAFTLSLNKVQRYYGNTRYETAVEISKLGWQKANTVVLTRGDLFPDALSGASIAAKNNAPMLLTDPRTLKSVTKNEINRLQAQKVIILGSDDAVSEDVVTDIKLQTGITNIERIGGTDRYETAALIARKLGAPLNKTAIVATGLNFPDALAAASISAYKQMPILLVNEDTIYPSVQQVLKDFGINRIIIVGGADVVSSGFASWFDSHGYPSMRLSGDDRYGTAKAIADYACNPLANNPSIKMSGKYVFLATGENFPDALTCGPLAGKNDVGAPILLTSANYFRLPTRAWITNYKGIIEKLFISGGPDVVSLGVKREIQSIIGF